MTNKEIILRLNSANLWVRSNEYFTYPMLLNGFDENKIYSPGEIMKIFMKPREGIETSDGRGSDHSIVENVKGISMVGKKIHHKGLNLFIEEGTNKYKLSENAIELKDLFARDKDSNEWKFKLAEILLKYELRFRALIYYITKLDYKLKNFVKMKGTTYKFTLKREVYLESPDGNKIYLFMNHNYNELLKSNLYEIIGPFIREELEKKSISINEDDKIIIKGSIGDSPNTSINFKALKLIFELFFDLDLFSAVEDNSNFVLELNYDNFLEDFDDDLLSDILKSEKEFVDDINKRFTLLLKKTYNKFRSDAGFVSIRQVLDYVCNELDYTIESEKKFTKLFWENVGNTFIVEDRHPGLGPEGILPDKKIRLYKLRFFI